jgi:hypothetical protein
MREPGGERELGKKKKKETEVSNALSSWAIVTGFCQLTMVWMRGREKGKEGVRRKDGGTHRL